MIQYTLWKDYCLTDKSYARDNRLIIPKSTYCWDCLAPRCRLILSWISRRVQGYVCSTFKKVRELGLERRETVWSLSTWSVEKLKKRTLVWEDRVINWLNSQDVINLIIDNLILLICRIYGGSIVVRLFSLEYCLKATAIIYNHWINISWNIFLK